MPRRCRKNFSIVLILCASLATTNGGKAQESSQAPASAAPASLEDMRLLARRLKDDLQEGKLMLADLHAIQLRLEVLGAPTSALASKIQALEETSQLDAQPDLQPELTNKLIPLADKLMQSLEAPDLILAKRYAEQLATDVHRQQESSLRANRGVPTGDVLFNKYAILTGHLGDALRNGNITTAAHLAKELQNATHALTTQGKSISMLSRNQYNINDALGRAAYLRGDFLSASDYLLEAGDTPGEDPVLQSFGPDLWLAKALLAQGRADAVLIFLQRCKTFWDKPQLTQWISELQSGKAPDLSRNVFSNEPSSRSDP